jgi:hypothetical protein
MGRWCRAEETEVTGQQFRRNDLLLRVDGNDFQHDFEEIVDERRKRQEDGKKGCGAVRQPRRSKLMSLC